jgi:hypothetical protein
MEHISGKNQRGTLACIADQVISEVQNQDHGALMMIASVY